MGKIVLNLAISLDGYICDTQGGFDWIEGQGDANAKPYDFNQFLSRIDTIIMGSIAYEDVVLSGLTLFEDKNIMVATHRKLEKKSHVTFVEKDICESVLALKEKFSKDIWLFGGAGLTDESGKS